MNSCDEPDEIITLFYDDAFAKLCPPKEQLRNELQFKEELPQETLWHFTQFIKKTLETNKEYTNKIMELLEWNINEVNKDRSGPAVALCIILNLIKKSKLSTAKTPDVFSNTNIREEQAQIFSGLKEAFTNLSEVQSFDALYKKIEVFLYYEWIKTTVKAIELRPLLGPALTAAKILETVESDLPHFYQNVKHEKTDNYEWEKINGILKQDLKTISTDDLLKNLISFKKACISFPALNEILHCDFLNKKDFWAKFVEEYGPKAHGKSRFDRNARIPIDFLLENYLTAEKKCFEQVPISPADVEKWFRYGPPEKSYLTQFEEEVKIRTILCKSLKEIVREPNKMNSEGLLGIFDCEINPDNVILSDSTQKFINGTYIYDNNLRPDSLYERSPFTSAFAEGTYTIPPIASSIAKSVFVSHISNFINKKYFLKALLEDEEAMKNLWEEENRLPIKEQGQSFHYQFIEYAIEKNGVSLFLSKDLPPTTVFNNEYAIRLCARIFRKLVDEGKLNASSEVNKKMEDFFSREIAKDFVSNHLELVHEEVEPVINEEAE